MVDIRNAVYSSVSKGGTMTASQLRTCRFVEVSRHIDLLRTGRIFDIAGIADRFIYCLLYLAWVGEILQALKAPGRYYWNDGKFAVGIPVKEPTELIHKQFWKLLPDSERLLFLACGLEDEGSDTFRLPAEGQEVPLATAFLSEYAAHLARGPA
eukprot:s109_g31.t1